MPGKINWKRLLTNSGQYVAASVIVSAMGFVRSIVFMKTMGHDDLGKIAILQSIIMAVGFLQLGMINGGYRLYASADTATSKTINNNILSCFVFIGCILIPGVALFGYIGDIQAFNISNQTMTIGVVAGLATLASTWINNTLIAKGQLKLSSKINLAAAAASLAIAYLPDHLDLRTALVAILAQPTIVTCLALSCHPPSRPRVSINRSTLSEILRLGFAPYCAGLVALINFQIERWFIASNLGTEALGAYYLTMVYATVFTLIPASLLNLFYPRTVNAYENGDRQQFYSLTKKHVIALFIYIAAATLTTVLALTPILNNYLTSFKGKESLVFISLPGLIALTLFDNVALKLQSAKKMFNIFMFALITLIVNVVAFSIATKSDALTLEMSAAIKSAASMIAGILIYLHLWVRRKEVFAWT